MKFSYDGDGVGRECVAYIDDDGELMVRRNNGDCIWLSKGGVVYAHNFPFDVNKATHKFYKGDSVTITF